MEKYLHRQIHDLLLKAQNPVFISDERVDGDSLGAALAMVDYMKQFGKRPPVFVSTEIPVQYQALPHLHVCTTDRSVFDDSTIDLVVTFDSSDGVYIRELVDLIPAEPTIINIDHHATNPNFGHINQVLVSSPATAEVIYRFFIENDVLISRDAATCLLAGLCFDTSAFSNAATNEDAFKAASHLVMIGGRVQDVIRTMFQNRSISALRVWGLALERLYEHPELNFVSTCLTREDIEQNEVTDGEIDGLSNFLSFVTDASTLFVLRETQEGGVKVSMRSHERDVSAIAHAFGGGGHKRAAGFTLDNARLLCEERTWKVVQSK